MKQFLGLLYIRHVDISEVTNVSKKHGIIYVLSVAQILEEEFKRFLHAMGAEVLARGVQAKLALLKSENLGINMGFCILGAINTP